MENNLSVSYKINHTYKTQHMAIILEKGKIMFTQLSVHKCSYQIHL